MKTGRAFWGAFLLTAGILLLLDRLLVLPVGWQDLWRLWPLVFVAWGVGVMMGRGGARWVAGLAAGVVLGLTLVALLTMSWAPDSVGWEREPVVQELRVPWDGTIEEASLKMDCGAGSFRLDGSSAGLFEAETRTTLRGYRLTHDIRDGRAALTLAMTGRQGGWTIGSMVNRVEGRLHPGPMWDLHADVGVARVEFALQDLYVRSLELNAGASKVRLRFGGRAKSADVRINAGASSVAISVPDSLGCELAVDAPLSGKRFEGFEKNASGVYRTEGFSSASHVIRFRIDAGVSSLSIDRE